MCTSIHVTPWTKGFSLKVDGGYGGGVGGSIWEAVSELTGPVSVRLHESVRLYESVHVCVCVNA